ncbi:hypothetical protein ACF09E_35000 [Streptomyces sp. NPDC014891]
MNVPSVTRVPTRHRRSAEAAASWEPTDRLHAPAAVTAVPLVPGEAR